MKIRHSFLEISRSRKCYGRTDDCISTRTDLWTLTFDLLTPKSNQFIWLCLYILEQSFMKIRHSLRYFGNESVTHSIACNSTSSDLWPLTFDVLTPKSNHFIYTSYTIPDLSFINICPGVLEILCIIVLHILYTLINTSEMAILYANDASSFLDIRCKEVLNIWLEKMCSRVAMCVHKLRYYFVKGQ